MKNGVDGDVGTKNDKLDCTQTSARHAIQTPQTTTNESSERGARAAVRGWSDDDGGWRFLCEKDGDSEGGGGGELCGGISGSAMAVVAGKSNVQ